MNSKDLVRKQKSGQDISADMKTIANQKPTLQNLQSVFRIPIQTQRYLPV